MCGLIVESQRTCEKGGLKRIENEDSYLKNLNSLELRRNLKFIYFFLLFSFKSLKLVNQSVSQSVSHLVSLSVGAWSEFLSNAFFLSL